MFDYWFLTPICIAGASVAVMVGIGGPVFFTPVFVLVLQLPPATAVATALFIQLFGFLSGAVAYRRLGLIDWRVARALVVVAAPGALLGSLVAHRIPASHVRLVFGSAAVIIAYRLLQHRPMRITARAAASQPGTAAVTRPGWDSLGLTAVGATLLGTISVGLAEILGYHLVARRRLPPSSAVATTVVVVLGAVLAAAAGHLSRVVTSASPEERHEIVRILLFSVPGVLIGGQLGPRIQAYLKPVTITRIISAVLAAVGITMIAVG